MDRIRATQLDKVLPTDTLLSILENEYYLDCIELWDFIRNCPGLTLEDKKSLLLFLFMTTNQNKNGDELEAKILEIWDDIDRKLNLSDPKKSKTFSELVKDLPEIWRNPCRRLMRRRSEITTDKVQYAFNEYTQKLNSQNKISEVNMYRLAQSFTYIKVTSKVSKNSEETLTLIMNTSTQVNVVKAEVIDPRIVILKRKTQLIGVIQNELLESLGTCNITLCYGENKFSVKFHVISQAKNFPFDGVLGRSFFEQYLVCIDYAKREITLKTDDWVIPFFSQMATFRENCLLKGHSERMIEVMVKNPSITKGYVPQRQLSRGLFVCRAIVIKDKTATITVTVRNIGEVERVVEPFYLELQPLPKFVEKDWPLVEAEINTPEYKEIEAKFQDFLERLNKHDAFPSIQVRDYHEALHSPNALLCPMNLDKVHSYSKIINSVFKINPAKPPGLHKVLKVVSNRMTTYLCTDRYLYNEQPSTKDTFIALYNLKEKLVSEKFTGDFFILEPNKVRTETPRMKLYKMIRFIFEHTEIEPIAVVRSIRVPKTDRQKFLVMYYYHTDKWNKHYGYMRTYNKIRDGFLWSTMKEDIMEYMLKCSCCKYNLNRYKALHKVLPKTSDEKKEEPSEDSKDK